MATAIRPTPMLHGIDAQRFEERMKEHRQISAETRLRMQRAYETFKKMYVES